METSSNKNSLVTRSNLKIKIIIAWLFIIGILSSLTAIIFLYLLFTNTLSTTSLILTYLFNAAWSVFHTYILFKTIQLLNGREKEGYRLTLILFIIYNACAILFVIAYIPIQIIFFKKDLLYFPFLIIICALQIWLLNILLTVKQLFTKESSANKYSQKAIAGFVLFLIVNLVSLFFQIKSIQQKYKLEQERIQGKIENLEKEIHKNDAIEVKSWQTYKNDTYRFRLEMPSNWFYKVYNLNSQTDFQFYDGQDSMVVFDSSELPTKPEIGHHFMITIYPSSNDFQNSWISDFEKKQAKNSQDVQIIQLGKTMGYREPYSYPVYAKYNNYIFVIEAENLNIGAGWNDIISKMINSFQFF